METMHRTSLSEAFKLFDEWHKLPADNRKEILDLMRRLVAEKKEVAA